MQDADLDRAMLEIGEIARDRIGQPFRTAEQIFRRIEYAVSGFLDTVGDGGNFRKNTTHGAGDLFGAAADAIDFCRLVIEDAGQLAVGIAHRGDARRHAGDGINGFIHCVLNVMNLRTDIAGCFGGLLRERLDL